MDPSSPIGFDLEPSTSMPKLSAFPKKFSVPSDDSSRDDDTSPTVWATKRRRRPFCYSSSDEETNVKSMRRRTAVLDSDDDDDSETDSCSQISSEKEELPLGVIQARAGSTGFQLIMTKYRPEASRMPCLDYAPVFYPTEQEFEDTLKYIESIRPLAEPFGICRIVPPKSWKPPCTLRDNAEENIHFTTRVQKIHKLQVREPSVRRPLQTESLTKRGRVSKTLKFSAPMHGSNAQHEVFGFEPGPNFTIKEFEAMANELKEKYFGLDEPAPDGSKRPEPSVQTIEGEFWRMVETPSEQIEVLYGADIETNHFKSGFPKTASAESNHEATAYEKSGWNLNNIARLKDSVLEFEEGEISGVVVPWLYIGMCFSSFCWHVEDHHLYSVNYMHWGSPKIWYGVPGSAASKLETAMKKRLPELFNEQPDLLHKLVTQLSPTILKEEGVPVYRVVQHAGDFVITFPRAYHAGFNCGFNCAEAVNVAPVNWLPHGQFAVELYKQQHRKTSISHDKLLLAAVKRATSEVKPPDKCDDAYLRHRQMLGKALKARIDLETSRRASLQGLTTKKMEAEFDFKEERECSVCVYDLHLSAVSCGCYPELYSCLEHAKSFCSCAWGKKYALYRYELSELEHYLRLLEGQQSVPPPAASVKLKIFGPRPQQQVQDLVLMDSFQTSVDLADTRHSVPGQSDSAAAAETSRSGPRVAKVVRPSNKNSYDIELLNVGRLVVKAGWYSKNSILPAGFRSRIRFYDYLNLPQLCSYISEVLDCTDGKPLFKVSMEGRPSEKYVCSSIDFCWQGIQERVNTEIKRLRQNNKPNLPPLRPPESLKGVDMFGFTVPSIAEAVESLDPTHLCTSYWKGRLQATQQAEGGPLQLFPNDHRYASFKGFLNKAGEDQLCELQHILDSKWSADTWFAR